MLKPGGRIGISDVVAEDQLTPEERAQRGSFVGCIAGALSRGEYEAGLEAAGFEDVTVRFTHPVADGMHSAIVQAVKTTGAGEEGTARDPARGARGLLLMPGGAPARPACASWSARSRSSSRAPARSWSTSRPERRATSAWRSPSGS